MNYVPGIYSDLSESEWSIVADCCKETDEAAEISVPLMSFLHGLILGNRVERIVQIGANGYATLLLGFMLRRTKVPRGLYVTERSSQKWIARAELHEFVEVVDRDPLASETVQAAKDYLNGAPELIILQSTHQYSAALRQIDLWYGALAYGGMLVVNDVSRFAQNLDATKEGGARRGFVEWRAAHPECEAMLINPNQEATDLPRPLYKDAAGLGLIHKPRAK